MTTWILSSARRRIYVFQLHKNIEFFFFQIVEFDGRVSENDYIMLLICVEQVASSKAYHTFTFETIDNIFQI